MAVKTQVVVLCVTASLVRRLAAVFHMIMLLPF